MVASKVDNQQATDTNVIKKKDNALYYVGIGASAGGLEALRPFVANLPTAAQMTYIIAQHMSPDHRSMMVELLSRETTLDVKEAQNKIKPKADTIYVAPANTDVSVVNGFILLTTPSNRIGPKPSADRLFISLAEDREDKCIGIILSGTGSDGAHGIKAIKAAGGITITQEPGSAKYDSMPNAAIRVGGADIVLPPHEIATQLNSIIQRPRAAITNNNDDEMPASSVQAIVRQILAETAMDFTSYKEATLSRQITRRMMAKQLSTLEDYGKFIKKNPQELRELANNFLICVTSFFRDKEAFDSLRKHLRIVIESKKVGDDIRIWVPGCATGEEVYSIAIMLDQELAKQSIVSRVQIFATDINSDSVHTARAGFYPEVALSGLPESIINQYFTVENGMYQIDKRLKESVLFARQDLVQDAPFVRVDLISCRNLLIYFKTELQERVMKIFHYSLRSSGILFLGKSESVGKNTSFWREVDRKNKVFHKRDGIPQQSLTFSRNRSYISPLSTHTSNQKPHKTFISSHDIGASKLFDIYTPASVLYTQEGEIIEIYGDCTGFLQIRKGKADFNVYSLIMAKFRAELRAASHRTIRENTPFEGAPCVVNIGGKEETFRIVVRNAGQADKSDTDLLLLSFEKVIDPVVRIANSQEDDDVSSKRIAELDQELLLNRENLQSVIEELETANEELQAMNEEAQAGNEELQASNEELETTNEELQASNEELVTVNDELNHRTEELSKTNDDMNNILQSLQNGILVVDTNLVIWRYNKIALQYFDIKPDNRANLTTVHSHYEMPDLLKHVQEVIKFNKSVEYEFNKYQEVFFSAHLYPYTEDKVGTTGKVTGVVIGIHDITEKKKNELKLKLSASVFENASEGTIVTDKDNKILAINPAFTKITGYTLDEVSGKTPKVLSSGKSTKEFYHQMWSSLNIRDAWRGEIENKRKNGEIYQEFLSINVLRDDKGNVHRHIGVFSDISDAKKAQAIIEKQANFDELTGLPNRSLIQDRLKQVLNTSRREKQIFAVFFLDLDNFKVINDALGHDAGDELLTNISNRLVAKVRDVDSVGRMGGDEFVVLLNNVGNSDDIAMIATKLLTELSIPIKIGGNMVQTSASIGITMFPVDGDSSDILMKNADNAMYEAKKNGRNTFSFFTKKMQDDAIKRQWLEGELSMALRRNQLDIYYQPVIDIETGQIYGAEALMRWNHPTRGMIPPDMFIPIAEQNGTIANLSNWLIDKVLREIEELHQKLDVSFRISMNLSAAEFVSAEHMAEIKATIQSNSLLKSNNITLELTESWQLAEHQDYKIHLEELQQMGCNVALDDFGTGYSSLSYLKRVPVNIVKIDKSFIRDLSVDSNDAAMIVAIQQMANVLGLSTIAEGVETEEQLKFLKANGCKYIQGYYFSKPLPYEDFEVFVKEFNQSKQ